jgi:hypothetical protein
MGKRGIPEEISDPFGEALVLLVQRQGGADEPVTVLDGKTLRISLIFDLVARRAFKDKIPASMLALLQAHAARDREAERHRSSGPRPDVRDRSAMFDEMGQLQEIQVDRQMTPWVRISPR